MNSQGTGTSSFTSWYRNLESSPLPDDDKLAVEAFVDGVYEKIETETGTDFMNNEGSALYRYVYYPLVTLSLREKDFDERAVMCPFV